jgi:hypothetical protein
MFANLVTVRQGVAPGIFCVSERSSSNMQRSALGGRGGIINKIAQVQAYREAVARREATR